jgi:UDP-glucose 4-epimerase
MLQCLVETPMLVCGDGAQTRDFTFVSDTARGIMAAGFSERSVGETFNLGSGKQVRITELANTIADVLNKNEAPITHVKALPGDASCLIADSSKAKRLMGFSPAISLKDGLAQLRDWYSSQGTSPLELLKRELVRNWEPRSVATHV